MTENKNFKQKGGNKQKRREAGEKSEKEIVNEKKVRKHIRMDENGKQ